MNFDDNEVERRKFKRFFWAYLVCGLVAMIGGTYAFSYRVQSLTPTILGLDSTPGETRDPLQKRLQELADLKLKDSDGDTLNDFDERYVYKTSAYLADTDADGSTDQTEVAAGDDPTCAKGATCVSTRTTTTTTNANTAALEELTPEELRKQLANAGIPQSLLDQISDEDLLATYGSVVAGSTTTTTTTNTNNTNNTNGDPYSELLLNTNTETGTGLLDAKSIDQLEGLSTEEIRELLKQGGATDADLEGIDDATLQQIYQETLQNQLDLLNTTSGQ